MNNPTPKAGSEAEIGKLLAAARECIAEWENLAFPLSVSATHEVRFRVGFPLSSHALNQVAVALEMRDRFPLVAASCARIALEHALAAQWVLLTRGGPETLVKHMEASYLTRTRAFEGAIREDPALTQFVEEADLAAFSAVAAREPAPGQERSWRMEQIFRRFADTDLFYDMYRELSGAVHPSYETLETHLDLTADGAPRRLSKSGSAVSSHTCAQAAAMAAVLALDFVERCRKPPPDPSPVAATANRYGLPYDMSFSDQKPHLQP
ncbi:hypothetical protein HN031_09255 [Nocardioides sp. zg-1308]|uniref:DUF5677 domain-containing protein n=1 Tax=Nocardioides sp. zg-1308 TaxID=2736253 RepID=UPI001555798B|nr:DUF5677 domain-containing protein [Nocardioides sp. zg-1308]NPD04867.1 hypothetical protein [Nocardioides sp. zg-1308]